MVVVLDSAQYTYGSGAAGIALPGSRVTVPTSYTTTVYDVNGLLMNVRGNLEHYWIKSIDGLYDAEIRDGRELNPDRDGETFFGSLYSGKPIVIEGFIYAMSKAKLEDMEFALAEAFDPIDEEYAIIARTGDFTRDWIMYVVKTGPIGLKQSQDSFHFKREFMLTLRSSRPSIFSYQLHVESINVNTTNFVSVTNRGNKRADPIIELWGSMTDIVIDNPVTQQTFRLTGNIPAGSHYEIDFEKGTIFDENGVNKFDRYDPTSDWLQLEKRVEQTLSVNPVAKGAGALAVVRWRDTYK